VFECNIEITVNTVTTGYPELPKIQKYPFC